MTLALVVLLLLCSSSLGAEEDERPVVPENLVLSLSTDAEEYLLGDNALLHFSIRVSSGTANFNFGGDNRNTYRSTRYTVTAVHDDGTAAADPYPGHYAAFGGRGGTRTLTPDQSFEESLPLARYLLIDRPGTYTISVSHDGGWRASPKRPHPQASMRVRFREPSADEAAALIASWQEMEWHGGTFGRRSAPHPNWHTIRHPIYVEPLLAAAQEGVTDAIHGLASIEAPEATKALLDLLTGSPAPDTRMTEQLYRALLDRAPRPPSPYDTPKRETYTQRLQRRSWQPNFAPRLIAAMRNTQVPESLLPRAALFINEVGSATGIPDAPAAIDEALDDDE